MFSKLSAGINQIIDMFHKLSSNKYESASNNHIDYSGFQGCLFSSKKQLDNKWYSGYKSANSEFIWESFNMTSKAFSVAKEINILNTVLINHYGVLDISRKSVEAEFDKYRESGFNFPEQREKIIESRNLDLSNTGNILAEFLAIHNKNIQAVKLCLEHHADPNATNAFDNTLLSLAIHRNYTEIVELLLAQQDIDLNATDAFGNTPLSLAIIKDNIEIVELLLQQQDINLNIQDSFGRTPLRLAKNFDCFEIVKVLESFTSDYNQNPDTNNNIPISDITKSTDSLTNHIIDPINNGLPYCGDAGYECVTILGEHI